MAYFSNGTEGQMYEDNVCTHCKHYPDDSDSMCPVWELHLMFSSEQHQGTPRSKAVQIMLDTLIPQPALYAKLCRMFIPIDDHAEKRVPAYMKE